MSTASNYQSYPPLFRPSAEAKTEEALNPAVVRDADCDGVPVIDFECMTHGDGWGEMRAACRQWGLFRLVNHGVPEKLMSQMLERTDKLFSMAFEAKQEAFRDADMSYFWGTPAVTPSGAAVASKSSRSPHWMEGLNVPLNCVSQYLCEEPTPLKSFRSLVQEYGKHQSRVGKAIYEALVSEKANFGAKTTSNCSKELGRGVISYLSEDTGILRLYRYLRCIYEKGEEEGQAWGIDAHTDSSLLSIIHQDLIGGLEVYSHHQWIQVKPIPNTLIVIIGDMMQAISDNKYASAKHRVKVNKEKERISIGYFVFPEDDVVIESSNYKPFTYADFRAQVHRDLITLGSKIGLHNFITPCNSV
ncbi:unnamed protein product [Cuscuta europaea]|uniref:feruloyl-CoA 6-hydroxylase n=1 Tax=Cuscuta europaea TaxID=41803 RepID=A0A9P0YRZ3_CUSEU|nr:unnamed protein product [Cuscuta europaea]